MGQSQDIGMTIKFIYSFNKYTVIGALILCQVPLSELGIKQNRRIPQPRKACLTVRQPVHRHVL